MAAKNPVRIAVVGMGIGRPNGTALATNPRGIVVALCDLFEDRMKAFAKDLPDEVKFYTDYKEMCKADDIDAVFSLAHRISGMCRSHWKQCGTVNTLW